MSESRALPGSAGDSRTKAIRWPSGDQLGDPSSWRSLVRVSSFFVATSNSARWVRLVPRYPATSRLKL
jgi:hypothetical protein